MEYGKDVSARGKLGRFPAYNPESLEPFQVDVRHYDVSDLDLSNRLDDLLYATFNTQTKWPSNLPVGFDPLRVMEHGKNPGLGVRSLHAKGITGRGVGLAIIDHTALLTDHVEYADRLRHYEEINVEPRCAGLHATAVASLAGGKTTGVAPEADLYFISTPIGEQTFISGYQRDMTWVAQAVDRVLALNRILPEDRRIRVVSISVGWHDGCKGYEAMSQALSRARREGLFIVSASLDVTYGLLLDGLQREPMNDPDLLSSYAKTRWGWYAAGIPNPRGVLLVPMDSRSTASSTGTAEYSFDRIGGWSWAVPYIAGLYALACQVHPDVTPESFWSAALKTADTIECDFPGRSSVEGRVVNPGRLIEQLTSGG